MRLWSLKPALLDPKGLVALWREGLLARNVLVGETKGYKFHPQLDRFKNTNDPVAAIDAYLYHVWVESKTRDYSFDGTKLGVVNEQPLITVTTGQVLYEVEHLSSKLRVRDLWYLNKIPDKLIDCVHPSFKLIDGGVEPWEKL